MLLGGRRGEGGGVISFASCKGGGGLDDSSHRASCLLRILLGASCSAILACRMLAVLGGEGEGG